VNGVSGTPTDIAPWDERRLLSTVIDAGLYEQKMVALPQRNHPPIPPAKRRAVTAAAQQGLATLIRLQTRVCREGTVMGRKTKIGYTVSAPTVHFSVGIAHYVWDIERAADGQRGSG
jgi:hypothetical protein